MNLYISGYRANNTELYNEIVDACYYFTYRLLGGHMWRNITVDLILKNNMFKKERAYGLCSIAGEVKKPREFEVELDASKENSLEQILTWLAHELVHVKQFVRGELFDYENGDVKWKSKIFRDGKVSYEDAPWEKEAYRLEDKLYLEYIKSKKKSEESK